MSYRAVVIAAIVVLAGAFAAPAAWVDPYLTRETAAPGSDHWIDVYVVLNEQLDLRALAADLRKSKADKARRHFEVVASLQELADATQPALLADLDDAARRDLVRGVRTFWGPNSAAFAMRPAYLDELRHHPAVKSIYWDQPLELIAPVDVKPSDAAGKGVENGILMTRAPELWEMGIDGTGALACDQDTGADGAHPAFAARWRGLDAGVDPHAAWFDPLEDETFPSESLYNTHGTHTLGTMVGLDGENQIGMAPGAKWIGAKTIDTGGNIYSDAVAAFNWMADPDGDPGTVDDVPDVVNNSWGIPGSHCEDDFWAAIDVAEAAGVLVVFAAGNEGPTPQSLRSPADRIAAEFNVFAIGATEQDGVTKADFTSIGPSACDHATIKPEVSAVGVDVRSAMPGAGYQLMSGTSMATPHVAGAVLLLRSAFPEATIDQVKTSLYLTAVDLGGVGDDNTFGNGRIDVVEAYNWLLTHAASANGRIYLDRDGDYSCADTLVIRVLDADLADATVAVNAASDSQPAGETVTLNLTEDLGVYQGSIATTEASAAGALTVADGDTITVTYLDADDGAGGVNVAKTDAATADCIAPAFGGLTGAEAGDYRVTLTWDPATDANVVSYNVFRSETSGDYDWDTPLANAAASPYVDKDAPNGAAHYYVVRAVDVVGNTDDNTIELAATPEGPDRLLRETFDVKGFVDWAVINKGCPGAKWTTDNELGRASDLLDQLFAVSDAGACMMGSADSALISPPVNTHHYSDLQLRFAHSFGREFQERGLVQYSIDAGATWQDVTTFTKRKEAEEAFDLPAECAGIDALLVRFEFMGGGLFDGWWGIDNVEVTGWPGAADDDDDDASPDDDTSPTDDDDDDDNDDNDDSGDDDDNDDAADDDAGDDDDDDDSGCGC